MGVLSPFHQSGLADGDAEDVADMPLQPTFDDKEIDQHPGKRCNQQRQDQQNVDHRAH